MDPETLWERVNDAINTIIRRDESTETGCLLPPCVEGTTLLLKDCFMPDLALSFWKVHQLQAQFLMHLLHGS